MKAPSRPWSDLSADEKGALVKPLFLAGHSYNEITRTVAAPNRGSVAGTIQRLRKHSKLPPADKSRIGREGNAIKKAQKRADPKPQRQPKVAGLDAINIAVRVEHRAEAPGLTISRAAAFEPLPDQSPIPFLQNTGCRWPVDGADGNGLLACGADRGEHRNYCAAHRRLAFIPRLKRAA